MIIVFEGIDGTGKTTLINKILNNPGFDKNKICILTSPIYYSNIYHSNEIYINGNKTSRELNYLLCLSSFLNCLDEYVIPALKEDKIVICDRWFYSNLFYSQVINNTKYNPYKDIIDITERFFKLWLTGVDRNTSFLLPDLIFFCDADISITKIRDRSKTNVINQYDDVLSMIQKGYRQFFSNDNWLYKRNSCYWIDTTCTSSEQLAKKILNIIKKKI